MNGWGDRAICDVHPVLLLGRILLWASAFPVNSLSPVSWLRTQASFQAFLTPWPLSLTLRFTSLGPEISRLLLRLQFVLGIQRNSTAASLELSAAMLSWTEKDSA